MGCAESVAVSRPMNNPAKPNQLSKKRNKRRPSQEEQVLGELPQPGEFDSSPAKNWADAPKLDQPSESLRHQDAIVKRRVSALLRKTAEDGCAKYHSNTKVSAIADPDPDACSKSAGFSEEQRKHEMANNNLANGLGMNGDLRRDSSRSMSFSENTPHTSASSENPRPSSGAGVETNPLALPPRRKSIDSMDDPEPSLLSIIGVGAGVVPDDNDVQPSVLGLGAGVYVPTGDDSQHDPVDIDEQPFFSSATSKDSGGWIPGASANTAIYSD